MRKLEVEDAVVKTGSKKNQSEEVTCKMVAAAAKAAETTYILKKLEVKVGTVHSVERQVNWMKL